MPELKRIETATYAQYTGDNLLEVIDFVFNAGKYSLIIEKTDEGKFIAIRMPSLNGACAPLSGNSILTPGDFLAHWKNDLYTIPKSEFQKECKEMGFMEASLPALYTTQTQTLTSVLNKKHFEKSRKNSDTEGT